MLRQLSRSLITAQKIQAAGCELGVKPVTARGILQGAGAVSSPAELGQSPDSFKVSSTPPAAATARLASLPSASWSDVPPPAKLLGLAGASIASFLGGIHWAMAMAEYGGKQAAAQMGTDRYVWSVTPCLMAWPAVVMAPGPASLAVASVLAVVHAVDGRFAGQKLLPQWYMVLRRPLSAFAISGMLITLVGSFVYSEAQAQQTKPRQQENLEA